MKPEPVVAEEAHHAALREQLAEMAGFREWNERNVLANGTKHLEREITAISDFSEDECVRIIAAAKKFLAEKQDLAQESL